MFSFLQVHKHIMLKPQGSLISSTSTEFSIESLLVVYNLNIMQQAGYIYANLPTLLFHVQVAWISQITVFTILSASSPQLTCHRCLPL